MKGTTALFFFMFLIIKSKSFLEKLGLAASCIKTLEIPFKFIKYFKALKVES